MQSQSRLVDVVFARASNIVRIFTFANKKVFYIFYFTQKLRNPALRSTPVKNYLWPLHERRHLKIHQAVGELFVALTILDHHRHRSFLWHSNPCASYRSFCARNDI